MFYTYLGVFLCLVVSLLFCFRKMYGYGVLILSLLLCVAIYSAVVCRFNYQVFNAEFNVEDVLFMLDDFTSSSTPLLDLTNQYTDVLTQVYETASEPTHCYDFISFKTISKGTPLDKLLKVFLLKDIGDVYELTTELESNTEVITLSGVVILNGDYCTVGDYTFKVDGTPFIPHEVNGLQIASPLNRKSEYTLLPYKVISGAY